jgi:WhiB family redox-sensing transcriptional regulator
MFDQEERGLDLDWLDDASCNGIENPDIFFPPRDKDMYRVIADEAKTFCFGGNGKDACPVRQRCLWEAVKNDYNHGIWGGLSHRERNALVRKWQRQYKSKMTLKEFIFQTKDKKYGSN